MDVNLTLFLQMGKPSFMKFVPLRVPKWVNGFKQSLLDSFLPKLHAVQSQERDAFYPPQWLTQVPTIAEPWSVVIWERESVWLQNNDLP